MPRLTSRLATAAVALATLAFSSGAIAADRPFKSRGTAQFTGPTTFVGAGNATHLGDYTEAGTLAFTPTANPAVLHVEGDIVYTADDGCELHAHASGELNGLTGAVSATITYLGGTGRLSDATGSSNLVGQLVGGGAMTVSLRGTIDY